MLVNATQQVVETDVELDTILSIVTWVFARMQAFIGVCNAHHSLWIPVGFSIAGMTIMLFKYALNISSHYKDNY